jgi:hypothetical protein
MATLITLLQMTTQKSSATELDCCHDAVLCVSARQLLRHDPRANNSSEKKGHP